MQMTWSAGGGTLAGAMGRYVGCTSLIDLKFEVCRM